jgi:hypothetical protein
MSVQDLKALDAARGLVTRSAYLRSLISQDPDPTPPPPEPPPVPAPITPPVPPNPPVEMPLTGPDTRPLGHVHTWAKQGTIFKRCTECEVTVRR